MKIFKEKGEEKLNLESKDNSKIIVPKSLTTYKSASLEYFITYTLYKLIEYHEYNQFMETVAKNYIEHNYILIKNIKNISNDDIETAWDTVNQLLALNNLGTSQIEINIKSRELFIYHYDSPFVRYLSNISNQKVCNFLSVLYSSILSNVFEENLNVSEMECKNEKKRNFCIFRIS
ncbi:MAG: hypothetical protein N2Z80_02335 [Hydrogenothermaceae bacterium]|nr:hypothetical protein [Hydrogenothermaceae bacterium]